MAELQKLREGAHPVRVRRKAAGLGQTLLAAQAGVPAQAIRDLESGRTEGRVKVLRALARALDLTLDDLAPWDGEETRPTAG